MTTPFYAPPSSFHAGRVVLPPEEARHAARVLRVRAGDEVVVVDGAGGWHRVRLTNVEREAVAGEVVETRRDVGEGGREVVLALGLLHHRDRFEWAVEKAVEAGISGFIPLRTGRAAPGRIRPDRIENIAVAAMKQSLRSRLPVMHPVRTLAETLQFADEQQLATLLAHEAAAGAPTPASAAAGGPALVLIGPEGGFSEEEVAASTTAGATVVTLGPRRLRAETAAVVALADLMLYP